MSAGPVFLSDNVHLRNYVQYVKQHFTHNYHCRTAGNRNTRVVKSSDCFDKTWYIAFSMTILCSDRPQFEPHPDFSTRAPAPFYQKLKTPFFMMMMMIIIIIIIIIIIEFFISQLWLRNIHLSWNVLINRIRLGGLTCSLKSFLQVNMCQELQIFADVYIRIRMQVKSCQTL